MSTHLSSFAMSVVVQIIVTFYHATGPLVRRLLSQGYKVNRLSNTFEKFYGSLLILPVIFSDLSKLN